MIKIIILVKPTEKFSFTLRSHIKRVIIKTLISIRLLYLVTGGNNLKSRRVS